MKLIERAEFYEDNIAICSEGKDYTYKELTYAAQGIARSLLDDRQDLKEERIAFLTRPSFDYVRTQWGIWLAGGIAVPLCDRHPLPSIEYVLGDAGINRIIVDKAGYDNLKSLSTKLIQIEHLEHNTERMLPQIKGSRRAMILYTSGTTNLPKGVVSTHDNITAQIEALVEAWHWRHEDRILNILPLHHVHGIINVLSCALWSGAQCTFLPNFDAQEVLTQLSSEKYNLFMAVPTIYYQLIEQWKKSPTEIQEKFSTTCRIFRLMVSGSAALPESVLEEWESITGQRLLERYGMTEIGMALSNPYKGERRPGHVGQPLPGVSLRLVSEGEVITTENIPGEIQVKGPAVFKEYWNKPEATQKSKTNDGWFKTGDVAVLINGYYKILGRRSVDIIKSGGYKISALEIEDALMKHPGIKTCAVVGIPDIQWGEIIVAAVVPDGSPPEKSDLKEWLLKSLPAYKLPRQYAFVTSLPRNTLGKVVKKEVKNYFE